MPLEKRIKVTLKKRNEQRTQKLPGDVLFARAQWQLVCDQSYVSDLVTSLQMAGLFVGVALFGQSSDLVGRKPSYYVAFAVMIGGGLASAFASSWHVYAACRIIVGVGFGGTMVVNCVYPLEFVGRRWRTVCGTVGFWAVGGMTLALMVKSAAHARYSPAGRLRLHTGCFHLIRSFFRSVVLSFLLYFSVSHFCFLLSFLFLAFLLSFFIFSFLLSLFLFFFVSLFMY